MNIVKQLEALLGNSAVLTTKAAMATYLRDERELYQGKATCVALPRSREEVAALVGLCRQQGYSIVPQGGNTGYCGGASPDARVHS